MTDTSVQPAAVTPSMSQMQRVISTFTAPSKTFTDVKNGHKNWLLAFLIVLVTGSALWSTITSGKTAVTWKTIFEEQQAKMPEFAKRMQENAIAAQPPEQQAATRQKMETAGPRQQQITWSLAPGGLVLINLVCALVLWPTINFGFGGKAKFGSIFTVWMYAMLPSCIKTILGIVVLYAGTAPESFNIKNFAPTNLGAFLNPIDTNPGLYSLATSIDFITIWSLVLVGIGTALVAGVKRGSGYIASFGWWALLVIIGAGIAVAFG